MDARRYIFEVVVPTLEDYERNLTSVRYAFLACVVAFHAVDYFATNKVGAATLRQKMREECPSFLLVDRVAHAFKHTSTGHSLGPVQPLGTDEVISRPAGNWDEAVWDLSRWDDPFGGVTLATDVQVDVLTELNRVLAYLKRRLPIIPDDWAQKICAWAARDARIESMHLFGSYAKGTNSPTSDLDLAVVISGDDAHEKDVYFICMARRWRDELGKLLPVKIDLQAVGKDTDKIVWPAVLQSGVRLYPA